MRLLPLVWKSLWRSKRRTLLVLLSLTLSVFIVTVLQSLLTTLDSVANNPNSSNRIVVRNKSGLTQFLPVAYEAWLRQQPEVAATCKLQWFGGEYKDPSNFFPQFASDETTLFQVFREEFGASGITDAQLKDYQRDGNGCIVGKALADKYGWKVGDTIPLKGTIFPVNPRLTVRIIFRADKPSNENVLHFHYKLLEEGVPWFKGRTGSFYVRVKRPEQVPALCARIDRHFANSPAEVTAETENAFNLSFVKMLGNINAIIQGITAAVAVAILIVTASTMAGAIRERRTEIAVLRAMGFRTGAVLGLLLAEGLLLVGAAGALGILLAQGAAGGVRGSLGMVMPFFADFGVAPGTALAVLAAAAGVGLLSTFVPAYQATRQPIPDGLKAV
ncbi:MAG TPA: FtsX-like permease family protein [Holophagaceae bacterium]|nr:FtsX-like permease family protein [Holophagaceae bacterium]